MSPPRDAKGRKLQMCVRAELKHNNAKITDPLKKTGHFFLKETLKKTETVVKFLIQIFLAGRRAFRGSQVI